MVPGVYTLWIECSLLGGWSISGFTKEVCKPFIPMQATAQTILAGKHPKDLLEQLYTVFGAFSLDPCSPTSHKRIAPVRAKMHFTAEENGFPCHGLATSFAIRPMAEPCVTSLDSHEPHGI